MNPLWGVVRIAPSAVRPIDVVVPKGRWVRPVVERAIAADLRVPIGGVEVAVVEAADLVLLKLYAGGFIDRRDILTLLAAPEGDSLRGVVDQRIADLPDDARRLWRELTAGG